jgi:hypothetical protein
MHSFYMLIQQATFSNARSSNPLTLQASSFAQLIAETGKSA